MRWPQTRFEKLCATTRNAHTRSIHILCEQIWFQLKINKSILNKFDVKSGCLSMTAGAHGSQWFSVCVCPDELAVSEYETGSVAQSIDMKHHAMAKRKISKRRTGKGMYEVKIYSLPLRLKVHGQGIFVLFHPKDCGRSKIII